MNTLRRFFKEIDHQPSSQLEEKILHSLRREEQVSVKRKARMALWSATFSAALFLGAVLFATPALLQSEFWSLFTLLFSDMSVVMNSFGEYLYSLLETLPVLPLAALLFSIALLGYSISALLSFLENRSERGFHKLLFTH